MLPEARKTTAKMLGRLIARQDFRDAVDRNVADESFAFERDEDAFTRRPAMMVCEGETDPRELAPILRHEATGCIAVIRFDDVLRFLRINTEADLDGAATMGDLYDLAYWDGRRRHMLWLDAEGSR